MAICWLWITVVWHSALTVSSFRTSSTVADDWPWRRNRSFSSLHSQDSAMGANCASPCGLCLPCVAPAPSLQLHASKGRKAGRGTQGKWGTLVRQRLVCIPSSLHSCCPTKGNRLLRPGDRNCPSFLSSLVPNSTHFPSSRNPLDFQP